MDLVIRGQRTEGRGQVAEVGSQETVQALVTVYCRPLKTYLLLASTNFLDWTPVATNTPAASRFDYPVPAVATSTPLFFRAIMLERLADGLGLSLQGVGLGGTRPYRARLTLTNALPAHALVFQASEDLRHWTPLATNTPAITNNWQFLDTNAPAFNKRFYRAVGQGK